MGTANWPVSYRGRYSLGMGKQELLQKFDAVADGRARYISIFGSDAQEFFGALELYGDRLARLSGLNLGGCRLATLPEAVGRLTALVSLDLSDNQLRTLPESVGHLTALTSLDLSGNQLTTLPEVVGKLTSLTTLNLSGNQLTTLPEAVGNLTALTTLHLSSNQLTTLPGAVAKLSALTTLDLSNNKLSTIPNEVRNLVTLTRLIVFNNRLTSLPAEVGSLPNLQTLDLSGNELTTIPPTLGKLSALTSLDLGVNRLTSLPETLGDLADLVLLDLSNNLLTALPDALRRIERLRWLFLHDNESIGLPPEVLGANWSSRSDDVVHAFEGNKAAAKPVDILNYYFATRRGARALREVKLILIGWGDVGKSTLADALQGKPFKKNRKPTEGIQISRWTIKAKGGEATVRIWDFGGQEIMHGTHQFFLTKRAIYVVLIKGRDGRAQRDAEYWLKHARAFGGDSTVLLVMNRQDEFSFDLDRNAISTKHRVPVDHFFPTECSEAKTIRPVVKKIIEIVSALLEKQANFPAKWWPVKTALEEMDGDYLSDGEYRNVCVKHGVDGTAEQDQLLDRLNDLGIIVHFADDALADLKVLDPEWATDGVYRVINDEKLREEKHGRLKASMLKDILPKERWPEAVHRRYIIDLMLRFDLCFPAEGEKDVYIVSDLLEDKTPGLSSWNEKLCVVFRYKYPVLPHGILPRFISKTYEMSEGRQRWRSGVVVGKDGAEALVRADYDENVVDIWVRGGHSDERRALLTIIRNKFEEIHGRFKDLNPEEKIAAPGHPKALITYRDLILDKRRGKLKFAVTIEGERQDVIITDVLDGMASRAEHDIAAERFEIVSERGKHNERTMSIHIDKSTYIDNSVKVGGNIVNAQVGQTLTNCTNMVNQQAPGKKKDLMDTLRRDVEELLTKLPPDKVEEAPQVAENLENALKQAAKDKPDRKWYSVSADGLMDAATWVEGFSAKITGTVKNLGSLIIPGFELPKLEK